MTDFSQAISAGGAGAWFFIPTAILIGALHGLEPGHSKTMMAAFIIAVRGTIVQAALLGLSAAISHSLVIWALAALALRFGNRWNVESTEPYFMIATGVIVIAMALWTIRKTAGGGHQHHHHHDHDETKRLEIPAGGVELAVFEDGVPPRFRVAGNEAGIEPVSLRTIRPEGRVDRFSFTRIEGGWESVETIPEPHEFKVEVVLTAGAEMYRASTEFAEHHDHHHHHDDHDHHDADEGEHEDAHAREHAEQIRRRFEGREVTTGQIVLFGLTGGLMPCPAALSILLICLHLKEITLGFTMVGAFSFGLALTLVTVGVGAAWGMRQISRRSGVLSGLARRAPQISSIVLIGVGLIFLGRGLFSLS